MTRFNYFESKAKVVIQVSLKGLCRVTMGTKTEPNSAVEKANYFNKLDESFGMVCLITSRYLLFHVEIIDTPNESWLNIESLFGKTDEMRGHQLKNELISLSPAHYDTI